MRCQDLFWVLSAVVSGMPAAFGQGWTDVYWDEKYDAYAAGDLTPQSNWELWDGSGTTAEAKVRKSQKYSDANSLAIVNENDVVWDFAVYPPSSGVVPAGGEWAITVKTLVPAGVTGEGNFICLSRYDEPNNNTHWAFQVTINATANTITYDGATGNKQTLALVRDQWTTLAIYVDLDKDRADGYYGDQRLVDHASWYTGQTDMGSFQLQAIDLYGGTAARGIKGGSLFLDDLRVETVLGQPVLVETAPNPTWEGSSVVLYTNCADFPGAVGFAFITGLDDVPSLTWVEAFMFQLDGAGYNGTKSAVPIGTVGHSFQGRVVVADLSTGPPYPHALGNTFSIEVK